MLPKIKSKKKFFKVGKILKGNLDLIPSPSFSVKIQSMGGKVCLRCKGKTLLGPAMFCLITSSKLSRQKIKFSPKVKVMRSDPGYLLKSFLLYL